MEISEGFRMNLVFISNYFSHHQQPLADALSQKTDFTFLATETITKERQEMGWEAVKPPYLCEMELEPERAKLLLSKADVLILGNAPEWLIKKCVKEKSLILRYSERPLKKGLEMKKFLPRLIKWHFLYPPKKPVYLLSAGAYVAKDYASFGLFSEKAYRFGYFPPLRNISDFETFSRKKQPSSILWVGRFLSWKHPDAAIRAVARLKKEGISFTLDFIGSGEMEATLLQMVHTFGLEDRVHLLGTTSPEMVRKKMEESEIFLFTSDRNEGWGAVLNEAMNAGCGVIANSSAGATPYLICDGFNGYCYSDQEEEQLYQRLKSLLLDRESCKRLGKNAYETIQNQWNAGVAASRLLELIDTLLAGEKRFERYTEGPCSIHRPL